MNAARKAKNVIGRGLHRIGYRVIRIRRPEDVPRYAEAYASVLPEATYSPWLVDELFLSTYRDVRSDTLVDVFRLFELWELAAQVAPLEADYLEVGCWRGGSAAVIAARARRDASSATVYVCDTFRGVVKGGPQDHAYRGGEHADTSPEHVRALFDRLGLTNTEILEGVFPDETGDEIADRRFGLVHVDVDVYDSARDVLSWVWPRVVAGGVVVFDDYGFFGCEGVTALVEEQRELTDRLVVHNLNGHGLVIKLR